VFLSSSGPGSTENVFIYCSEYKEGKESRKLKLVDDDDDDDVVFSGAGAGVALLNSNKDNKSQKCLNYF
jgi:hypothetical protein